MDATEETEATDTDIDHPTGIEDDRVTEALAWTHNP